MTKEQVIEQLKSLKADRESFIQNDKEHDKVFLDDIEAIETVLSMLEEQKYKIKQLGKGQQALIQSRRKWKRRYYKIKNKNKDLQKSVNQIYDDYQNIWKMAFNYSDKIEEQDKIINKLKKHNDELLRKLKNRVKQVKKLEKYSTYKSEFSRLNKKIKEQDKIIDLMSEQLTTPVHDKEYVKQYFENKVNGGNEK